MIRVVLPTHLWRLANVNREIEIQVGDPATLASVLDVIEDSYPMLRGTIRDHVTKERRPFIRFFACGEDLSHEPQDTLLPGPVVEGVEPLRIVGAMAGGSELAPSQRITNYIAELEDWRGEKLARLRQLIDGAEPDLVEEWKWDTPVWSNKGNVVAVSAFKDHVKVNFFKGASLEDPDGLFNAGLDAKATRAIDLYEGDAIAEEAFKELVRAAAAFNASGGR